MALKDKIKEFRIAAGMSQTDLGRALGLSAQAVSKWENGKSEPDSAAINRMCELFETTPSQLFGFPTPQEYAKAHPLEFSTSPHAAINSLIDISASPAMQQKVQGVHIPMTTEARILSEGVDRMPETDRKRLLKIVEILFEQYSEFFTKGSDENDT